MVLIVHSNHPWTKSGIIDISELKTAVMILREQGSGTRRTLEKKLEEKGVSLEKIPHGMELGSTRAVITAVEAGLGVSVVSRCAVNDALELKRISEIKVQGFDLHRSFYLVRQNQSIGGFAVEAFCNFIKNIK
jgi:DNA-binding transcriptional LysR family regulator